MKKLTKKTTRGGESIMTDDWQQNQPELSTREFYEENKLQLCVDWIEK